MADFAEALARRRDELWARGEELAVRERQLGLDSADTVVPDSVALAGVAACVRSLVVETGDDVATVAAALDVDPQWARGVLTGEVTEVDPEQMQRLASALEVRSRGAVRGERPELLLEGHARFTTSTGGQRRPYSGTGSAPRGRRRRRRASH